MWRACGGVRAVMFALIAVDVAVRDVMRACRTCVFVCLDYVCGVPCVACWCTLLWVTRAMMLTRRCARWGLSCRVCLRARVFGSLRVCCSLISVSGSGPVVSVHCCITLLLCCGVCGTAFHGTVAAAVSSSSRAAAVMMRGSSGSGYCAVS